MSITLSPSPLPGHPLLPILDRTNSLAHLKQIHALALKTPSPHLLLLYTRILASAAATDLSYASRLLHHPIPPTTPNSFAYNTLIRAYARSPHHKPLALTLYRRMLHHAPPDNHTFPFALKACAFLAALPEGTQLHAHLTKLGFASDVYVLNSLIHFYSSCGLLSTARQIFDKMPHRSQVSWNVIIDGYSASGEDSTVLSLFREMQHVFTPDTYTMQSVVAACGGLGTLSTLMWAYTFLIRNCSEDVLMNNSLVDAFAKCGSIDMARQVFDRMPTRDIASWNAMISGLAMHGCVKQSLHVFHRMVKNGLKPSPITFVGVLSACNHGSLVAEGQKYFNAMVGQFGIEPELEHYGCMVDLLARAGCINEALDIVLNRMSCKPDAVIWRSLVDACCKRNAGVLVSEAMARRAVDACCKRNAGVLVSEAMARRAIELDSVDSSGAYVLLSRVYALANRWDEVGLVRKLMSEEGVRKEPGCSTIEMDGIVHGFVAGDTSHPRTKDIYNKLEEVEYKLALVGYEADSSQVTMVAEIGVKEDSLRLHSERLAVAFGLLSLKKGIPIRIMKNLRVCRDCHTLTKMISCVYDVEIIMRDRIRFHHFKDGSCSCMDCW